MTRKKVIPIDLTNENPCGRVDVLAAKLIDQFIERAPELKPIVTQQKEAIHHRLNELCGPSVVDFSEVVQAARPFMPLLGAIANKVIASYREKQKEQELGKSGDGNQAA